MDVRLTKNVYLKGVYGYARIKDKATENTISGTVYLRF